MVHWMLWMLLFFIVLNFDLYHPDMRQVLTTSAIWSDFEGFVGILIILFPMACMCLVWLNVHLVSWILVLMMFVSRQADNKCTLLHFSVIWWLYKYYKTSWTGFGSFLPMLRIQTFVLYLTGNSRLHGMLFSDWYIYYMLWYSQYCVTMTMGVSLGGKLHWLQIYHIW